MAALCLLPACPMQYIAGKTSSTTAIQVMRVWEVIMPLCECLLRVYLCWQAAFWSALPATLASLKAAVEASRRGVQPHVSATLQVCTPVFFINALP